MKRLLILAGCLSLAACQTPSLIPPTATVAVAEAGTTLDAAYNVAAQAYVSQLPTMSASVKATVKPLLVKAYGYVQAADQGQVLGNATTVTAQAQAAMDLIAQAKAALGVK
jgi:hypothetical protein